MKAVFLASRNPESTGINHVKTTTPTRFMNPFSFCFHQPARIATPTTFLDQYLGLKDLSSGLLFP